MAIKKHICWRRCAVGLHPDRLLKRTITVYRFRVEKSRKMRVSALIYHLIQQLNLDHRRRIMYLEKRIEAGEITEVEKYHTARYGKKGIRPAEKKKPTPEQMKKINERNAIKKLRRLMNANFSPNDYHTVLTYRREERPDPEEAKKHLRKLLDKLRREYRKRGEELKYITVTEYAGKAIHHHILINSIEGTDRLLNELWQYGRPHNTLLDSTGQYGELAAYFVKETQSTFREPGNPNRLRYSCSRNLKKPKETVRVIQANEWRKEPKAPKGYEIIKDSVSSGVSEMTGYGYQYYMMRRIQNGNQRNAGKNYPGRDAPGS